MRTQDLQAVVSIMSFMKPFGSIESGFLCWEDGSEPCTDFEYQIMYLNYAHARAQVFLQGCLNWVCGGLSATIRMSASQRRCTAMTIMNRPLHPPMSLML